MLREFVQCLTELIRNDVDWLARYGGEEFLVVLPETEVQSAINQAERLRKSVSKKVIEIQENQLQITASFGVTGFASHTPEEKISYEAMINRADEFMYEAKEKGRNRVIGGPYTTIA